MRFQDVATNFCLFIHSSYGLLAGSADTSCLMSATSPGGSGCRRAGPMRVRKKNRPRETERWKE